MMHPILKATLDLGQSIWLDYISRRLLDSGELERLVVEGVRGMTSNPTIFEQAVSGSSDYDADIAAGRKRGLTPVQVFDALVVADVVRACAALMDVYEESAGRDGFVSLEVSPHLAHETQRTIAEAGRLWRLVNRPNLMIKVPGTREGVPAVRALLSEGLNINVTLIFSLAQYRDVLAAFLSALEDRLARGEEIRHVASVASFFVSRVDSVADKQLAAVGHSELLARAAVANACVAYRHFSHETESPRWRALAARGAQPQRPLWASTSTKNPAYSDVLYVEELVARDTVNTVPPVTLAAWKDHGRPALRLLENLKLADDVLSRIRQAGVDVDRITEDLIEDGVKKFADSYDQVVRAVETKMRTQA